MDCLEGITCLASFIHFDSRPVAYDGLLEALKDEEVHRIGLYGVGGCGKTTLAREVGKKAEQLFSKVIFVVVSRIIEVGKIQQEIASQLDNLKLEEEKEPVRARHLYMRLSTGERFLIILDDVWEMLDFDTIGIPLVENHKGCTVLITTRSFDVCRLACDRTIHLKDLNENEACALFQKYAGLFYESSNPLNTSGQEILNRCGGSPLAIATVASSLKGKSQVEWEEALEILRDSSPVDIEEGLKYPYKILQLSYDHLRDEVAKSLFLLCSVFPEDYEIPIDQLTIIGGALGMVGKVYSYQRARNRIIIGIYKLIDTCMLVDGNNGHVRMHALLRDTALWIAKKEIKLMTGQARSQKALKEDIILKDDIVRYLWFDEVDAFSYKLDCPHLLFLSISLNVGFPMDLTNVFLKCMDELRVLILGMKMVSKRSILQCSKSIHLINNLRCLFLSNWSLGNISFIGSLNKLESLILWDCSFNELPECITEQKSLRLLDVWRCDIQRNPYEVVGRCSQLEVLYLCENRGDWRYEGKNVAEFFDDISITQTLESYCIDFGENDDFDRQEFPITRSLYVEGFETCITNATIKDLMQRAEVLSLGKIHGSYKNVIPGIFQTMGGNMSGLTQLSLLYSYQIEYVIDIANHLDEVGIISKLTHLTIQGVKHLKSLCRSQLPSGLFATLQVLEISECDSLEHIIADDEKEIVAHDNEYQRSYKFAFPKLKSLIIQECSQLKYLMSVSYAQSLVQLEVFSIQEADKLKSVFGPSIYEDPNPNKFQIVQFSALTDLFLQNLPNIVSICPENYHTTWPSLKSLELRNCPRLNSVSINHWTVGYRLRQEDYQLVSEDLLKAAVTPLETLRLLEMREAKIEVIFDVEGLLNNGQQVNSTLEDLGLYELPELRHIWRGPKNFLLLEDLDQLTISECENLKVIFPSSILRSLPQLRDLFIYKCKELEEIIGDDDEEEENQNVSNAHHQVVFPNLNSITIRYCHKLKCVFPISTCGILPHLKEIHIRYCKELEEIIKENQNVTNPLQLVFPNLTAIYIRNCHKLKRVFHISSCRVLPKLKILLIKEASELEQVIGDEKGEARRGKQNSVIPNLECVILWKLPTLTAQGLCIDFQSVRYLVVLQCLQLTLTSTVAPEDLLNELRSETTGELAPKDLLNELRSETIAYWEGILVLKYELKDIMEFNEDCTRKTKKKIDNKESEVESASMSEHITSGAQNNEQKLTGNSKESKDQSVQEIEISKKKSVEESSASKSATIFTSSSDLDPASSLQGSFVCSLPKALPHGAKGSIEGSSTENANIFTSLSHSEPESSLQVSLLTSQPKAFPHNLNETMLGSEMSVTMLTALIHSELIKMPYDETEEVNEIASSNNLMDQQQPLSEMEITNNDIFHEIKSLKEPEDQITQEGNVSKENDVKARFEGSKSEIAKIVPSSTHSKLANSLPGILLTSPPKELPHIQSQINQRESDTDKDMKANPLINRQGFKDDDLIGLLQSIDDDYSGGLPISSVPGVATTKDKLVAKTLVDLEGSLKMPLKDIATSEATSLRLRTALNFLSRLSLDRALSPGLKAIIKSIRQDFPGLLYSFKQAFATVNKFEVLEERDKSLNEKLAQRKEAAIALVSKISKTQKFMDETEEKEARLKEEISRLEKKRKDCEAELLSLQDQRKKFVAETVEFRQEFETLRKEKVEMVEDHKNARQQLFQADHEWSVLCSQFEQNIADRNLS